MAIQPLMTTSFQNQPATPTSPSMPSQPSVNAPISGGGIRPLSTTSFQNPTPTVAPTSSVTPIQPTTPSPIASTQSSAPVNIPTPTPTPASQGSTGSPLDNFLSGVHELTSKFFPQPTPQNPTPAISPDAIKPPTTPPAINPAGLAPTTPAPSATFDKTQNIATTPSGVLNNVTDAAVATIGAQKPGGIMGNQTIAQTLQGVQRDLASLKANGVVQKAYAPANEQDLTTRTTAVANDKSILQLVNTNFGKVAADLPTAKGIMTTVLAMGLVSAPAATLAGLGTYLGLDKLEGTLIAAVKGEGFKPGANYTLADLFQGANQNSKALLGVLDFLGKGAVANSVFEKAPSVMENLVKETVTKYTLPEKVSFSPQDVKDIVTTGKPVPNQDRFIKMVPPDQWKAALKNGTDITIPSEKLVQVVDRPWWSKFKEIVHLPASEPSTIVSTTSSDTTVTPHISGQLEAGNVKSPEANVNNAPANIKPETQATEIPVLSKETTPLPSPENTQPLPSQATKTIGETTGKGREVLKFTPATNLTPAESAVETKFAKTLNDNFPEAKAEYTKQFGNVLNTDNARELSTDYKANRSALAPAVHEPASAFVRQLYEEQLKEPPKPGQENAVLFTAGGTGAGKTTAINTLPQFKNTADKAQIVYDTNLASYKSSEAKVQQALDAGKSVHILYVIRNPVDAMINGAIPRAIRMGRTVPQDIHVATHVKALETVKALRDHFKDNPLVTIAAIDNNGGKGGAKEIPLSSIDKIEYNAPAIKQSVATELKNQYDQGKISKDIYEGFTGRANSSSSKVEQIDNGAGGTKPEQANEGKLGTDQPISQEALKGTELNSVFKDTGINPEAGFIDPGAVLKDLKAQMEKAKIADSDAKFGETLRTYFVGERDVRIAETNQQVMGMEKLVPKPEEQEALTFMRDFKNRPGEAQAIANGTHEYYDKAVERFKEQNPKATEAETVKFAGEILKRGASMKKLIDLAEHPTPGMIEADKQMTAYFKSRLDEGKKLGFLDSKISPETYITHLLMPVEASTKVGAAAEAQEPVKPLGSVRNKIGRYFEYSKSRAFSDVAEAYINGSEPRTLNALDAMTVYGDKHATVAATKLLVQQLKDTELGKWGSKNSKYIPKEWKPIAPEQNLFKNEISFVTEKKIADLTPEEKAVWDKEVELGRAKQIGESYVKADVAHQSLYAPEKVVKALEPITTLDYMHKIPLFGKTRLYQAYIKSAELGLSVFHMRAMNITATNNMGATGLIKAYQNDMKKPEFLASERAGVKAGLTTAVLGRTIEAYKSTAKPTLRTTIPTRADLMRMVPGVKQLEGAAQFLTHQTFSVMQRKFKVTDFALSDAAWVAKHPNATDVEHFKAQRDFAKEINAAYGGLQWEILGVNKMTQSAMKFFMLAPDWTFSNWFNAKAAFPEGAPGIFKGNGGEASMKSRAFWLRSFVTGLILTQLYSVLMSGQMSKDPFKAYLGTDPTGKEVYTNIGFAGAPSDAINLFKNMNDYGIPAGVAKTIAAKEAPLPRTAAEMLANRNYLGQTIVPKGSGIITGTARSAYELGVNLAPIPFSISNTATMLLDQGKKYIPQEFVSIILGGGTATHQVPSGMRAVTSGTRKGQLVPASAPGTPNSFLNAVTTGKLTQPKRK